MHNKVTIKDKIIDNLSTKELYNLIKADDTDMPIGFSKWMRILNNDEIKQYAKHMLGFLHQILIENKHKVMRWKILHYNSTLSMETFWHSYM